jgi:hypothetical protein
MKKIIATNSESRRPGYPGNVDMPEAQGVVTPSAPLAGPPPLARSWDSEDGSLFAEQEGVADVLFESFDRYEPRATPPKSMVRVLGMAEGRANKRKYAKESY